MPRMWRVVAAGLASLLVFPFSSARAQSAKPTVLEGKVLLAVSDKPVAKATVRVLGGRADGQGRVFKENTRSDNNGTYSVTLPNRKGLEFAVEAEYDGGLFVGDSLQVKPGSKASLDIKVWKTASDPGAITITDDRMVVAQDETSTQVLEVVTVENDSRFAYVGRGRSLGAKNDGDSPTLGFALPTQAVGQPVELIDSSLNRLYATETDFGFASTVAIPPGETSATFRYVIPGDGGRFDLTRRALYPTDEITILATDPLEIDSDRFRYEGEEEISDEQFGRWSSRKGFDAGDTVPVLAIAEGSESSSLWVGMLIGFGVILVFVIVGLLLRSRPPARAPRVRKSAPAKLPSQDELVAAIAELDLKHDAGEITDSAWNEERMRLKSLLLAAKERQPTS